MSSHVLDPSRDIEIVLRPDYRLIHEPLRPSEHDSLVIGESRIAENLAERLRHSDGGAFLVTGFRGVGKTTAVRAALRQLGTATGQTVVGVELSLARDVSPDELLFEIVRRLYEGLDERAVLTTLAPSIRAAVDVAYARTSHSIKETRSNRDERTVGYEVGGTVEITAGRTGVKLPGPKLSASHKRSRDLALELSFLTYSTSDAEHDLRRILDLLKRDDVVMRRGWRGVMARVGIGPRFEPLNAHVVIVLDEVDKLTEGDGGSAKFELLLSALKNVFSVSGVHFVMVAGVDSHDAWVRDVGGPNSIYRSVFAWQGYAPCVWGQASEMLRRAAPAAAALECDLLARYLEFNGRGVLRSLHAELNEFVSWHSGVPRAVIRARDVARVELLAELELWTSGLLQRNQYSDLLASPVDEDRIRLSAYYAIDWILRNGAAPFDADAIEPAIDPILRPSTHVIKDLLEELAERGFLFRRNRNSPTATRIGARSDSADWVYWLSPAAQARLRTVAQGGGRGRAQVNDTVAPDVVRSVLGVGSAPAPRVLKETGYELVRILGVGGVGTVWEGVDPSGGPVAIKIITSRVRDHHPKRRLLDLAHPGLVRTLAVLEDPEVLCVVMEFVPGPNLGSSRSPLTSRVAARIAHHLLDVLDYLQTQHLARLDLKPDNIHLRGVTQPVIVDLDTLTSVDEENGAGRGFFGTELYAAPEAFRGHFDIRSDIYSLGVTVLTLLGEPPHELKTVDPTAPRIESRTMYRPAQDPDAVDASEALRHVLSTAIALDPDRRFQAPAEMKAAISATPEMTPASGSLETS